MNTATAPAPVESHVSTSPLQAPHPRWADIRQPRQLRVFTRQGHPGDRRYLVSGNDEPFYWLADTAWQFFWWTTDESARAYLRRRQELGFTVVLSTLLPFKVPYTDPSACGGAPFVEDDPSKPDAESPYWRHVDYCVDTAAELGMYIGLLPTWGRYVNGPLPKDDRSETTDAVFTEESAYIYGRFLGGRYGGRENVVWVFGGDRRPDWQGDRTAVYEAMVEGSMAGVAGLGRHPDCHDPSEPSLGGLLKTYHPGGGMTSSTWFHTAPWLDFNMSQSGHAAKDLKTLWSLVENDYGLAPVKPALNGEPNYENHPVNWNVENEWFDDYDARKGAYLGVFAGGFGNTYGTWSTWQIQRPDVADFLPGLTQMQHLRRLMESRPFLGRIPDQELVAVQSAGSSPLPARATRDHDGSWAMVYLPGTQHTVTIDMNRLSGRQMRAWWYRTSDGVVCSQDGTETDAPFDEAPRGGEVVFTSPDADGPDWVLVLDDAAAGYPTPGDPYRGNA